MKLKSLNQNVVCFTNFFNASGQPLHLVKFDTPTDKQLQNDDAIIDLILIQNSSAYRFATTFPYSSSFSLLGRHLKEKCRSLLSI